MPDVLSRGQSIILAGYTRNLRGIDPFGRHRVSFPKVVSEFNSFYDVWADYFDTSLGVGSVAHNATLRCVNVDAGTAAGTTLMQQHLYNRYQPGRGQLILGSFVFGAATANKTRRIGYYDANDGFYVEQLPTGVINWVLRSTATGALVTTTAAQSTWNIDKLDGTGESGKTLDPTKIQILTIDFQHLGAGLVRVGFDIDGETIWVHEFKHANNIAQMYMRSGSLPFRVEVINSGAAAAAPMQFFCCSVLSEGGQDIKAVMGRIFSADNFAAPKSVTNTAFAPIFIIRPLATFGGVANVNFLYPESMNVFSDTRNVMLRVLKNPTSITGGAFSTPTGSFSEVNTTATAITGGTQIYAKPFELAAGTSVFDELFDDVALTCSLAGVQDTLAFVCQNISGATSVLYAGMNWKEVYR